MQEFALDLCNPLKAEGSILDALTAGGNQVGPRCHPPPPPPLPSHVLLLWDSGAETSLPALDRAGSAAVTRTSASFALMLLSGSIGCPLKLHTVHRKATRRRPCHCCSWRLTSDACARPCRPGWRWRRSSQTPATIRPPPTQPFRRSLAPPKCPIHPQFSSKGRLARPHAVARLRPPAVRSAARFIWIVFDKNTPRAADACTRGAGSPGRGLKGRH